MCKTADELKKNFKDIPFLVFVQKVNNLHRSRQKLLIIWFWVSLITILD
jgi:hypothetical protein